MQLALPLSELLAAIDFGSFEGLSANLTNFGQLAPGRYVTLGQESFFCLALPDTARDCVVAIDATPIVEPDRLESQIFMIALDDRLLGTVRLRERTVVAFRFPLARPGGSDALLRIVNLSSKVAEKIYLFRDGQPMGMEVHGIRLYRLGAGTAAQASLPGGAVSLSADARRDLAERFDTLGLDCQFGIVQRRLGAEPLGLLRFVGSKTAPLVEGLIQKFADLDREDHIELHCSGEYLAHYRVFQRDYELWYDTGRVASEADAAGLRREQVPRLTYLRREFFEDVARGIKIFVLTSLRQVLQEEAFALLCALRLSGPATLLWTTHGEPGVAGRVDRLEPGFLRGHLGALDSEGHADVQVWTRVLLNACRLAESGAGLCSP